MSTPLLTNNGAVCDLAKSYQLDNANNESQFMCGPWSVSELKYAGRPGHGPAGNAQQVDDWAEKEYQQYIGPNTIADQQGSSIDNMHQFLKDAGLHWWDIAAIAPGSQQASDLAHLHAALDAGYPVLVTVNEQSVKRHDGSNPYPWQPAFGPATHIFTVVGHRSINGVDCLLVDDELNEGDNWPDTYREDSLECHWASIVQLVGPDPAKPWLKSIPSDSPSTWEKGFNAQDFAPKVPTMPHPEQPKPSVIPATNGNGLDHQKIIDQANALLKAVESFSKLSDAVLKMAQDHASFVNGSHPTQPTPVKPPTIVIPPKNPKG